MKARFTDEHIAMIKEQETGQKIADVCRRHGISHGTFYKYKSKYGGLDLSDAKRLRAREDDNGKLPMEPDWIIRVYNQRGTAEQHIREGKQANNWTQLSCMGMAQNEVRLQLHALA